MEVDEKMKLTEREKEICKYIIEGKNNCEIGEILHISKHTVKAHLKHIFQNLNLFNRTELAYFIGKNDII